MSEQNDLSISDLRALVAADKAGEPTGVTQEAVKPEAAAPAPAPAKTSGEKPAPDSDPVVTEEAAARGADGKFKAAAKEEEDAVPAGVQKRIDKAVKAQREAERERDELRARQANPGSQPANQTAQPVAASAEPDPNDPKFPTYDAYLKALTTWQLDVRDQQRADAEQAKANAAAWKTREAAAKDAHDDYDEVLAGAAKLPISRVMHEAIVESELGPELAYYLATNPDDAARINALGPNAGAREMGKLEAKLAKPAAEAAPSKPEKAAKPLPRPAASVGGSHSPAVVDLNDPNLDQKTFNREFRMRLAA